MLNSGLSFGDDLSVLFELAALERLLRVDDLVRPRRVLKYARTRGLLIGQLAFRLGESYPQVTPVVAHRLQVRLLETHTRRMYI